MNIKIIRHSERLDYTNPFYWLICFGHYWADTPLTSNGYFLANQKGKELAMEKINPLIIYTSPYNRAMATATEIKDCFPQSQLVIEPLLAEFQPYYGHKISLYPNGIPTCYDGIETNFTYPEKYPAFAERIKFILSKIIEKNDNDIIIVTHGEVIKYYTTYIQSMYPDIEIDNTNISYLSTLSFDYDKKTNQIDKHSVMLY